ncbi:MAG: hypothetical protein ACLFP9_05600, partial [Desulfonatronovibrio sp.]
TLICPVEIRSKYMKTAGLLCLGCKIASFSALFAAAGKEIYLVPVSARKYKAEIKLHAQRSGNY